MIQCKRGENMINIQIAKQQFKKYICNYDKENYRVKVKIIHMQNVSKIAKEIGERKKLELQDVQLAELIGLLHDIGRFEQAKIYDTFIDKDSVNHGELGVQILFEQGIIRNFIEDTQYDEIIRKAILNHNRDKRYLEFSNAKEELHTKIIRDADKTDILYQLTIAEKQPVWGKEDLSQEKMSDEIYREFIEEKEIDYQERKTAVDLLVSHFAYIFDFNDKRALQIVKENDYFEKLYKRFQFQDTKTRERMEKIYQIVKENLENIEGENR